MEWLFDKIKLIVFGLFVTFGLVAFLFSSELESFWLAAVGDFMLNFGIAWIIVSSDKPWRKFEKERYRFLSEAVPMMLSCRFQDCFHDWEYGFQKNEVDSMCIVDAKGTFFSKDYLTASKAKNGMYMDDLSERISFSMSYVEYGDFAQVKDTDHEKSDENGFCGCIYDFDYIWDEPYRLDMVGDHFLCMHPSVRNMIEKRYDDFRVYAENPDRMEKLLTKDREDAIRALFQKYQGAMLISIQDQHLYVAIQDEMDPFEVNYDLHWNYVSPDQSSVQIKNEGTKDNIRKMARLADDLMDVFYSRMDFRELDSAKGSRRKPDEAEFLRRIRKEIALNNRKRFATYVFVSVFVYVAMLGGYFFSVNR